MDATALRQRFIRRVEGNLPLDTDLWVKARRGYVIPPLLEIDTAPLVAIREATDEQLTDLDALTDLIAELGISGHRPHYFPERLQGRLGEGMLVWQYPIQLAPYLIEIGERGVKSYLEVGTQYGGTFCLTVEYLRRLGTLERADAVDFKEAPAVKEMSNGAVRAHQMNSASRRFKRLVRDLAPIDLALIDGDHSAVGCMMDFCAVESHARMVAFHDIADPRWGVREVWEELKQTHAEEWEFREFDQQYPEVGLGHPVLGLGLMIRR